MDSTGKYLEIVAHYESCLERHGDSHLGVDWPNARDAERRYDVMLGVIPPDARQQVSLLDFGCGAAHLYEQIRTRRLDHRIAYSGLDLSPKFVALCRQKFPGIPYYCLDVLAGDADLPQFDYIVMNGVFTEKDTLSQAEMLTYFQALVTRVFAKTRVGLAFNVMSKQVDWERSDLFHLSFDVLATFLTDALSRHFVIRHDYRLYEYTTYVYREGSE
ncbi:MAG TPA: class I SAM-dependent methyltransferase [Candidatus Acidoferrales bacterium]|nr:class I SAM-dependent methyltransferase [Candidatus Acidoferrales bacterium]